MRVYRVAWLLFCGVLGAAGAVMAFTWSLSNLVLLVVFTTFTGAIVTGVALTDPSGPARLPRDKRRIMARSTVLIAGGTISLIGLGTLVGALTALLLLVIGVGGSPSVIRHGVRWLSEHGHLAAPTPTPTPPPEQADVPPRSEAPSVVAIEPELASTPQDPPDALSDEALCRAWRASFSALQKADSPAQRFRIVDERRAYLDEIERRTARGMAAWLASGPRAAGDPSRFVLGDSAAGRAPINWDNLLHDTDK